MFLRLCTRAPFTAMLVRTAAFEDILSSDFWLLSSFFLELTRLLSPVHEREFLHLHVAHLGQLDRGRDFADEPAIGQVFARSGHTLNPEVALEVIFDFSCGARFAHFLQVLEDGTEKYGGSIGHVSIDRIQRR